MLDREQILSVLHRVVDPCSIATGVPISIPEMGMVKRIDLCGDDVHVELRVTSPVCWQAGNIIARVEELLAAIPGVRDATCSIDATAEWMPDMMAPEAQQRLRRIRPLADVRENAAQASGEVLHA